MKIRTLFIITLLFFSLSSIITYAIYCSSTMNSVAKKQYEQMYSDVASNSADNISEYFKTVSKAATAIGNNDGIKALNITSKDGSDEAIKNADSYVEGGMGVTRILILNKNGDTVVSSTNADKEKYNPFTKEQLDGMIQGDAYINPIYDENDRPTKYEIAAPYITDDRIVMVYFDGTAFDKIVKAGTFPINGRTAFIDKFGNMIDTSYMGVISDIVSKVGYEEYKKINDAINNAGDLNKSFYFDLKKTQRATYTIKCSGTNWFVATLAEADKAYVYSNAASSSIIGLVVGLSILFLAVYTVSVILVTKPLTVIKESLTKIHRGDHDLRIDINTKNEYKDIAESFNTLLDNVVVSERRYRTIVEMSDDIVFEWNLKTNNITFSNNFNKKFSYRAPSDHFSDCFLLKGKVHPDDNERYRSDLAKLEKGEDFKDNTYRWKNIFGDYIWMQMKTSSVKDQDNKVVKIIGVMSDVDRAKKGELQLLKRASYDALTGVYNRETIENVIDGEIQKMSDGSDNFAILFVDIDDFKVYNDQYSHATGDQVLKFVTDSIGEIIGDSGYIGRYGGDEFIVCVRNVSTNIPENIAKDILAKLKAGFVCDTDDHLTVSVSIGVYIVSDSTKTVEEIISTADEAMYKIKKNGKASFGIVNG